MSMADKIFVGYVQGYSGEWHQHRGRKGTTELGRRDTGLHHQEIWRGKPV